MNQRNTALAGLFAAALIFSAATTATATTYDLTNGLDNGFWYETWPSTGGPGQAGNVLTAADALPIGQYLVGFGLKLTSVSPGLNAGEYWTTYNGGQINMLADGPWGGYFQVFGLSALNHSFSGISGTGAPTLWFDLTITGTADYGASVSVHAVFDSTRVGSTYGPIANGHKGSGFETLSVTIPDGGSTLVLMGSVLLGFGALGRRKLFNR